MRPSFLNAHYLDKSNKNFILSAYKNKKMFLTMLDTNKNYILHDFESDFEVQNNVVFSGGMKCRYYEDTLQNKIKSNKPYFLPILNSNTFDNTEQKDGYKNNFNINLRFLENNENLYRCGILFMPSESLIIKTQGSCNPYFFILNLSETKILLECNEFNSFVVKNNKIGIADYNSKVFKIKNLSNRTAVSFVSLLKIPANSESNFSANSKNIAY